MSEHVGETISLRLAESMEGWQSMTIFVKKIASTRHVWVIS